MGGRALSGRGWELAPLEAPGPAQCLKAPAGLFLQDKSRHLNCEGPGSKYVRFHGPSGVCCSYLNSAAEVEKQPQIMCKWMSTAVFQRNFIYGTEIRISYNFLVWVFFPAIWKCENHSYKKWWYGFGLPAPCSKRWVAASLHSLMDGKRLLTPSCPWAFLSLHWQWSAASSHDKECKSDGNATSVTAAPHPEQKVKINLRFLALWVTNILQVAEGSVAWLWTNTIPYGILRMRKEEAAREKLKYSMREWLECRCLIYLTLLPSRI